MKTYTALVTVEVEVEAFSHSDAEDIIHDTFDPGELAGLTITKIGGVKID